MALGGRNCPYCRQYNADEDTLCARCGAWIPPEPIATLLREPLITELWATKLLAGISIVVFALELAKAGPGNVGLLSGMKPSVLLRFGAMTQGFEEHEPWRALAGCFVHMGVLHVLMNMVALAELGRTAEQEVKGARLVIAYVVTGILGFVASAWWYSPGPYFTAGASGAVFGIDGLLIAAMAAKKDRRWRESLVRTLIHSFMFYFAMNTNQAAHLGGLAAGLLLGLAYATESRPWHHEKAARLAAVFCIFASFASIAASTRSPLWRMQADREIEQERYMDR